MRVLVTGPGGFIGKAFLKHLLEREPDTDVYAVTSKDVRGLESPGKISIINYRLESLDELNLGETEFDRVFHIGAFIPKAAKNSNQISGAMSNIDFTGRLLQQLDCKCRKFVFLSTVDVYGITESQIGETSSIQPVSLYGHSKLFCEALVQAWALEQSTVCQILRIGHIYGPGEEQYQKLIPLTIMKALRHEAPEQWGSGTEKRSFLHIDDCVNAIYQAGELNTSEGIINVASGNPQSVREIIWLITELSMCATQPVIRDSNSVARNIVFNTEKMHALLGKEKIPIRQGLLEEIAYLRKKSGYTQQ